MKPERTQPKGQAVGIKQALRAVRAGLANEVYYAKDADNQLVLPLLEAAREAGVPIHPVDSMKELGKLFKVQVPSAAAATTR